MMPSKANRYVTWAMIVASSSSLITRGVTAFLTDTVRWAPLNSAAHAMIFTLVWSLLVLGYAGLWPRLFFRSFNSITAVVLECISILLWIASDGYGAYCYTSICGSFVAAITFLIIISSFSSSLP